MRRCRSCLKVSQQSAVLLYATHYGEALRPRRDTSVEEVSIRPARRLHTGQYARSERTAQRALHCRCGRGKVLALGMCATCYTLNAKTRRTLGVCGSRCSNVTATAAAHAERLAGESVRSSSITGCRASHGCTL